MTGDSLPSVPPNPVLDSIFGTVVASLEASGIVLGDRLGCWAALAAAPAGVDDIGLAQICGIHPRYAQEWLEAMGAGGLLTVDNGRFSLAPGVAEVLADPDSPTYLLPILRQSVSGAAMLRELEHAYRTGDGVEWSDHDPDMRDAQGDINRRQLTVDLPQWIREQLPATAALLDNGGLVADVGCGYGWASVGISAAFPQAHVEAFDPHFPSAQQARRNVLEAGLVDQVSVAEVPLETAEAGAGRSYDLVMMAEMLHDVSDPVGVLTAARSHLSPSGVVLVMDMKVEPEYTAPAGEVDRMMYGFSLLICLPGAMTTRPTAATGTVFRPATLRSYATQAGLTDQQELLVEHDSWRFWALRP